LGAQSLQMLLLLLLLRFACAAANFVLELH
jgi:hypothetical protein